MSLRVKVEGGSEWIILGLFVKLRRGSKGLGGGGVVEKFCD